MIVGTFNNDTVVGEIKTLRLLTDAQGVPHENVRAMVLREATREEWIRYTIEQAGRDSSHLPTEGAKFYEISVD